MIYKSLLPTEQDFIDLIKEKNHRDNVSWKLIQQIENILNVTSGVSEESYRATLREIKERLEVVRVHGAKYKTEEDEI